MPGAGRLNSPPVDFGQILYPGAYPAPGHTHSTSGSRLNRFQWGARILTPFSRRWPRLSQRWVGVVVFGSPANGVAVRWEGTLDGLDALNGRQGPGRRPGANARQLGDGVGSVLRDKSTAE